MKRLWDCQFSLPENGTDFIGIAQYSQNIATTFTICIIYCCTLAKYLALRYRAQSSTVMGSRNIQTCQMDVPSSMTGVNISQQITKCTVIWHRSPEKRKCCFLKCMLYYFTLGKNPSTIFDSSELSG